MIIIFDILSGLVVFILAVVHTIFSILKLDFQIFTTNEYIFFIHA